MGDKDLLESKPKLCQTAVNAGDLVAGVNHDSLVRLFIAEDGAIALQRTNDKGLEDHGTIVVDSERGSTGAQGMEPDPATATHGKVEGVLGIDASAVLIAGWHYADSIL